MKFYKCKHCGNIIAMVHDSGVNPVCCGEAMIELKANSVDASNEKHVPVVNITNKTVTVTIGSVEHPMVEEHYILWIALKTSKGFQLKYLQPGEKPERVFELAKDEEPIEAYELCNLHGLWMKKIN